jgi:membrane fusion protein (multidrug efflux system)
MSSRKRSWLAAGFAVLTVLAPPAFAQQGGPGGPVPVTVVTVKAEDVTLTSLLPGRVVASSVAEVRPQVDGIIKERLFTEGTAVTVGDPLYRIDDAVYSAQVAQAEAQVAQAEAQLRTAQQDATRNEELLKRNTISQQTRDDSLATRDAAAAALALAKAQLMAANINLDRTTIRAPLTGMIGRSLTTQGALVSAGQGDALTVIRALDPVNVDVTQSAAEMLRWRRGEDDATRLADDPSVTLTLADGTKFDQIGHLAAAEPYVNESTGVVLLRMQFNNPVGLLLPGMYVQVEMPLGIAKGAIIAPQEGVSRDTKGQPIAYVVTADNVIETRALTLEGTRDADWIVTGGLNAGDRVVVEGTQRISNGAAVAPEERGATPAPAAQASN